ncbi:bacillithiol system redox-active protein YtxJ [Rhodohalobacter mucosus]|uniref:Bacillithiol system redox-active protein YtxJ n=1 Tax=Rhodohalobacter mucosus TaxID=2079485 RepID=A0A316TQM5_9BACT|nr:bacillithiol system redox-active protein YtxJ [Rhodohalobacter mucosus]PWN06923.1 bacillithiol system redox-active protein YtxJ [Rhodohalobacter mucosus]
MSFFDRLRALSGDEQDASSQWVHLSEFSDLKEHVNGSGKPVLIYKHSDRCATCFMTRRAVEQVMANYSESVHFVYVDVIRNRELSSEIARKTSIRHESPQVIILKNDEAVFSTSHGRIRQDILNEEIEKQLPG